MDAKISIHNLTPVQNVENYRNCSFDKLEKLHVKLEKLLVKRQKTQAREKFILPKVSERSA